MKGSIFDITFHKLLPRLGYKAAIWAIAHRLCRLLWLILRKGVHYRELGPSVSAKAQRAQTSRWIRELRKQGYRVEGGPLAANIPA